MTPSDSVAVIAASAAEAIPYFKGGLKGVARYITYSQILRYQTLYSIGICRVRAHVHVASDLIEVVRLSFTMFPSCERSHIPECASSLPSAELLVPALAGSRA